MRVVLDASVAVGWFMDQPHSTAAVPWLRALARDPRDLGVPDLLPFEVPGAFVRLTQRRDPGWSVRAYERFLALPLRMIATTPTIARRSLELSRTLRIAGWDAVYLAHAEALGVPWLTGDRKILRRLARDPRVVALGTLGTVSRTLRGNRSRARAHGRR